MCIYYAAIIIACFLTFRLLGQAQGEAFRAVHRGTLFYDSSDAWQRDTAGHLSSDFGTRLLDRRSAKSTAIAFKVIGSNRVTAPTLLFPSGGINRLSVGTLAIRQTIDWVDSETSPYRGGQKAAVFLALFTLAAPLIVAEFSIAIGIFPLAEIFGLMLVELPCVTCRTGQGSLLNGILLLSGLCYFAICFTVFQSNLVKSSYMTIPIGLVSATVPFIQLMMLCKDPKLCTGCVIAGAVPLLFGAAVMKIRKDRSLIRLLLPGPINFLAYLWILALAVRASLNLLGIWNSPSDQQLKSASVLGESVSSRFPRCKFHSSLILVGSQGCPACGGLEAALTQAGLDHDQVEQCTVLRPNGCFDSKADNLPVPLLVVLGRNGTIVYQHFGWPAKQSDQTIMISQLREFIGSP